MEQQQNIKVLRVYSKEPEGKTLLGRRLGDSYDYFSSNSAQAALEQLQQEPVQLVFFDFDIPDMKPEEFLNILKERHPETAVVLISESGNVRDAVRMIKLGVDDIIYEPVDIARLSLIIPVAVEKHRIAYENRIKCNDLERDIENRTREFESIRQELDLNNIDTIKSFVGLLETRHRYLGSHCKRVATICRAISEKYDIIDRVCNEIEIGALLHDIGKIGLADILLQKSHDYFMYAQLTNKEKKIIQRHPLIGQEAVEMIEMLKQVGLYIRHHHERYDGSGYPDGLKGDIIPLGARIIGVVDAYDRIVLSMEKRKQKEAMALFLKYLRKHKGKIFDPEVSGHLIDVIKEHKSKEYSKEKRIGIDKLESGMVLARDVYTSTGVLLISQYERLTHKDVTRLFHFRESKMIMNVVYIYGSLVSKGKKKIISPAVQKPLTEKKEELTFEKVCSAIDSTNDLRTLPTVYTMVTKKLSDPKSTRDDIAEILKQDPVIVTKLLRIVNSPLFGFLRRITTIEDAIPLLGFNEIRHIVTSLSVLSLFQDGKSSDIFNRRLFWRHSIGCAIICKIVANKIGVQSEEEYFTAGLLHDIGRLVLDQLFPGEFREVIRLIEEESIFMRQAERTIFGRPHQFVGEYLLEKWKIPDILKDAVKNHHSPKDSEVDSILVSAVHISDIITHMLNIGKSGEVTVPKLDSFAEHKLGISLADFEILIPEIDEKVKESDDLLALEM